MLTVIVPNTIVDLSASYSQKVVVAQYRDIAFADPFVSVLGRQIGTDANTAFSYVGPGGNHAVRPMSRQIFFSNPHYFPYWDKICTPAVRFTVRENPDSSLSAVSILWEPDYC